MDVPKPNAQLQFDDYISQRDFACLSDRTIAEVRRLTRFPASGSPVLYERACNGAHALNDNAPERHWALFEVLANALWLCEQELARYRQAMHAAEMERLRLDPVTRERTRRRRRINQQSALGTIDRGMEPPKQRTAEAFTFNRTPKGNTKHG